MIEPQPTGVLVDTNVISEFIRREPDPGVMDYVRRRTRLLLVPVVVLHELEYGLARMPPSRRRDRITSFVADVERRYGERILDLDRVRAREGARIRAQAERAGRTIGIADALIAGTARAEGIPLATRNVRHFEGFGIQLLNPWEIPRGG